jgi:hypothetical protein
VKKTWVIIGVVIVVVLLVGGTLLMDRSRSDGKSGGSTSAAASAVPSDPSQAGSASASSSGGTTKAGSRGSPTLQTSPVALKRVSTPPTHTTAFIDASKFTPNSAYAVTFVPYGIGPMPKSLVVNITTSKAIGNVARPFDFVGKNALISTSKLSAKMVVKKGGRYAGTIKLVNDGGVLLPTFTSVSSAK